MDFHMNSRGFRSGEYDGKKTRRIEGSDGVSFVPTARWEEKLSMMRTILSVRVILFY